MGKLKSYRDLGRDSAKANWLESWKKQGMLICVPHREPPSTRIMHACQRIEEVKSEKGASLQIRYTPFVCWEEDYYHKQRRFDKSSSTRAEYCPVCRFIEYIENREDLPDDELILSYRAGRGDLREFCKGDLIGKKLGKDSYMSDLTGKTEFVFSIIPYDDPAKGVCLTNEKWSLGQEFVERVNKDLQLYGDEEGDPERSPIPYIFEYNKETRKYSVSRYNRPKAKTKEAEQREEDLMNEIRALWEGPAPDVDRYTRPSNPRILFESFQDALQIEDVPLEDIFGPAMKKWEMDHPNEEDDPTDFNPDKIEAAAAEEDAEQDRKSSARQAKRAATQTKVKEPPKEDVEIVPLKKTTRQAKKPEPKPEVQILQCENCGGDWPEDLDTCPHCGATAEVAESTPPPPTPVKKNETRASKF